MTEIGQHRFLTRRPPHYTYDVIPLSTYYVILLTTHYSLHLLPELTTHTIYWLVITTYQLLHLLLLTYDYFSKPGGIPIAYDALLRRRYSYLLPLTDYHLLTVTSGKLGGFPST